METEVTASLLVLGELGDPRVASLHPADTSTRSLLIGHSLSRQVDVEARAQEYKRSNLTSVKYITQIYLTDATVVFQRTYILLEIGSLWLLPF